MIRYFEIHATSDTPMNAALGWKSSAIDGDPDLGSGVRYYQTTRANSYAAALALVDEAKGLWPNARRLKIEHVLFDVLMSGPKEVRKTIDGSR